MNIVSKCLESQNLKSVWYGYDKLKPENSNLIQSWTEELRKSKIDLRSIQKESESINNLVINNDLSDNKHIFNIINSTLDTHIHSIEEEFIKLKNNDLKNDNQPALEEMINSLQASQANEVFKQQQRPKYSIQPLCFMFVTDDPSNFRIRFNKFINACIQFQNNNYNFGIEMQEFKFPILIVCLNDKIDAQLDFVKDIHPVKPQLQYIEVDSNKPIESFKINFTIKFEKTLHSQFNAICDYHYIHSKDFLSNISMLRKLFGYELKSEKNDLVICTIYLLQKFKQQDRAQEICQIFIDNQSEKMVIQNLNAVKIINIILKLQFWQQGSLANLNNITLKKIEEEIHQFKLNLVNDSQVQTRFMMTYDSYIELNSKIQKYTFNQYQLLQYYNDLINSTINNSTKLIQNMRYLNLIRKYTKVSIQHHLTKVIKSFKQLFGVFLKGETQNKYKVFLDQLTYLIVTISINRENLNEITIKSINNSENSINNMINQNIDHIRGLNDQIYQDKKNYISKLILDQKIKKSENELINFNNVKQIKYDQMELYEHYIYDQSTLEQNVIEKKFVKYNFNSQSYHSNLKKINIFQDSNIMYRFKIKKNNIIEEIDHSAFQLIIQSDNSNLDKINIKAKSISVIEDNINQIFYELNLDFTEVTKGTIQNIKQISQSQDSQQFISEISNLPLLNLINDKMIKVNFDLNLLSDYFISNMHNEIGLKFEIDSNIEYNVESNYPKFNNLKESDQFDSTDTFNIQQTINSYVRRETYYYFKFTQEVAKERVDIIFILKYHMQKIMKLSQDIQHEKHNFEQKVKFKCDQTKHQNNQKFSPQDQFHVQGDSQLVSFDQNSYSFLKTSMTPVIPENLTQVEKILPFIKSFNEKHQINLLLIIECQHQKEENSSQLTKTLLQFPISEKIKNIGLNSALITANGLKSLSTNPSIPQLYTLTFHLFNQTKDDIEFHCKFNLEHELIKSESIIIKDCFESRREKVSAFSSSEVLVYLQIVVDGMLKFDLCSWQQQNGDKMVRLSYTEVVCNVTYKFDVGKHLCLEVN